MRGGVFVAAAVSLLLCLYILVFRREALNYLSKPVRYIFWAYLVLAVVVMAWGISGFIAEGPG